jgi:hypothetical protein
VRTVALVVTLICGIVVSVGVFLPWVSGTASLWGHSVSFSLNGLEIMDIGRPFAGFRGWYIEEFVLPINIYDLLVLVGGIVMAVCAFPAMIISSLGKAGRMALILLGIVAALAAITALGGAIWFIVDMMNADARDYIGYGVYMSASAALLGLIFGAVMTSKA